MSPLQLARLWTIEYQTPDGSREAANTTPARSGSGWAPAGPKQQRGLPLIDVEFARWLILPDCIRQGCDLPHQAVEGISSSISTRSAWTHRWYFSVSSASS